MQSLSLASGLPLQQCQFSSNPARLWSWQCSLSQASGLPLQQRQFSSDQCGSKATDWSNGNARYENGMRTLNSTGCFSFYQNSIWIQITEPLTWFYHFFLNLPLRTDLFCGDELLMVVFSVKKDFDYELKPFWKQWMKTSNPNLHFYCFWVHCNVFVWWMYQRFLTFW